MRPQSSDGQGSRNWNSRTSHQAAPLTVSVDIERTQRGNNGNSNANALFPAPASSLVAINMSNQKIGTVGGVSLCNALLTLQSIGAQSPSPTPSSNRSTTVIGTHLRYLGLRNNLISARGGTLLLRSFAPVEAREGSNCAEFDRYVQRCLSLLKAQTDSLIPTVASFSLLGPLWLQRQASI